jgi:hypothetical protein
MYAAAEGSRGIACVLGCPLFSKEIIATGVPTGRVLWHRQERVRSGLCSAGYSVQFAFSGASGGAGGAIEVSRAPAPVAGPGQADRDAGGPPSVPI